VQQQDTTLIRVHALLTERVTYVGARRIWRARNNYSGPIQRHVPFKENYFEGEEALSEGEINHLQEAAVFFTK
jgi:hypothetical protein